jgi:copper chaperone CopZ
MDTPGSPNRGDATATLSISGMTCSGCAAAVTRVLARVPGVAKAEVDFATERAVVTGGARQEDLIAAVQAAGYGATVAKLHGLRRAE